MKAEPGRAVFRAAVVLGLVVSFVAGVDLARLIRPLLLVDPEPAWAIPRLVLGLFLIGGTVCAGGIAASALLWLARRIPSALSPAPFPLRRGTLILIAAGAILLGTLARFASLERLPPSLWIDDVSLISPALELHGTPADFRNAIRPAPSGVPKVYGSVGVLYLELYRVALLLFGTTVFGMRFLSAAAGVVSLITALALGRALLPRGGGTLAAVVLAGLRWNLLQSRWGWNAIVLAPVLDVAALLLVRARRRESLPLTLLSGVVAGLAAHIYLAAWIGAAALLLLAAWPREREDRVRPSLVLALAFAAGFACAAAPIFLLKEGRMGPYFARASDHNLLAEIRYTRSAVPVFAAAADSLAAPWFKADPHNHHDLPRKARLGWILGVPVALALVRSLIRPREAFSAFLLTQGCAAVAASVAGGYAGVPNGYRFGYLTDVTAVAAAGGTLCLIAVLPEARRRSAAIVALGLLAISGALGARDTLLVWPYGRETFDGFHGQDTVIARSALRWEPYGAVTVSLEVGHSPITIGGIRRYRLDPDLPRTGPVLDGRHFRIVPDGSAPQPGERRVESVRDAWGRSWAQVLALGR